MMDEQKSTERYIMEASYGIHEPERPCGIEGCVTRATVKITLNHKRRAYVCEYCAGQIAVAVTKREEKHP